MKFNLLSLFLFYLFTLVNNAQVFDIIIAQDGSGDYLSLSVALDRGVSDNNSSRTNIFIKKGIYKEKVILSSSKTNVSLIGENIDSVIITWDDYSGKDGISTATSYTFLAEGNDLYAENITFENSAGNVGQAVAIRTTGDRQVFKNCKFKGFQDTYYAHKKRQYIYNCYIEGATDFIFGDATTVFENCTIQCVKGGQYITAPSDTKLTSTIPSGTFYHGLLFKNCKVQANEDVNAESYYLGRPWQPNASSVFISCTLGEHIKKEGWSIWSGTNNHESGCYAEFKNIDETGNLVDTTNRVTWSKQLKQDEVDNYYSLSYFLKKDDIEWNPVPETEIPNSPSNISANGNNISWDTVNGVLGYIIIRNNIIVGYSTNNFFSNTVSLSGEYTYNIIAVGEYGNLSQPSIDYKITGIHEKKNYIPFQINIMNNIIHVSQEVDIKIFSITGTLLHIIKNESKISLDNLDKGIYIIKFKNKEGNSMVSKILI